MLSPDSFDELISKYCSESQFLDTIAARPLFHPIPFRWIRILCSRLSPLTNSQASVPQKASVSIPWPPFQQVQAARVVCSGKMDPDNPSIVIMKPSGLDEPGFYNALATIT